MKEDGSFYGAYSFALNYVIFGDVVDGKFVISREVVFPAGQSTEAPVADCSAVEGQLGECQSGRSEDQQSCDGDKEDLQNALDNANAPFENYHFEQVESSEELTDWEFTEVRKRVVDELPEGHELRVGEQDGFRQFVVYDTNTDRHYATCVFYDSDANAACPENAQCGTVSGGSRKMGWPNPASARVKEAFARADFRHEKCASSQSICAAWEIWWKGFFVSKTGNDQFLTDDQAASIENNICVSPTRELLLVTRDGIKRTCVGYGETYDEPCPNNRDYVCGAMGWGFATFGWPGQICRALGYAAQAGFAGQTDFYHPQCSGLQNRVTEV